MMNAFPFPAGPTEIPASAPKTGRPAANTNKYEEAEYPGSFASTLKAVHEKNQPKCHPNDEHSDEAQNGHEIADGRESDSVDEECETSGNAQSAQGMPIPVVPADNPTGEDGATSPVVDITEESAKVLADNTRLDPSGQDDALRLLRQEGKQRHEAGSGDKQPADHILASDIKEQKERPESGKNPQAAPGTSSQGPITPSKATQTAAVTSDAISIDAALGADSINSPDAQTKNVMQRTSTDADLKALSGETSERTDRTVGKLFPGDGDTGEHTRPEMDRFGNRFKSRIASGDKEGGGDASQQGLPPGPQTHSTERASAGEMRPLPATPAGEAVRETLLAASNEATGQAAERQGQSDSVVSFTTFASAGKAATAAPSVGTTTPTTAASEQFLQDNFHQLVERAIFTVRGEQSEARIALKPDHLGHVEMRVVTEHHLVSIKIMTESPVARDLIDAHAHQLKSELQHQGLTVEHIEVSVSDGQGDAYRGERQRESFLRHMASQGQSKREEDIDMPQSGLPRQSIGRNRTRGIDYFA